MARHAYDSPLEAAAVDGEVVLTAPEGAASVSLTPTAALATAARLERAAIAARGQSARQEGGETAD